MAMPGRNYNSSDYRFGFGGMEKDNEVSGNGNSYDFGARTYDPRLGRFKSIDPFTIAFPAHSPYSYALNSPIFLVDADGMYPKPSEVLADFGVELPPLAAGILDGAADASPLGMLGFVYDLTTDSQFRSDMVNAFAAIANDPVGAMKVMFEEYAETMERVMAGEATDADLYLIGEEVGGAVVGLITGGAIAKYSKKLLKAGTPKGKVAKKVELDPKARGRINEGKVLGKNGLTKNNEKFTVTDPKTGESVTTIPDAILENGQTVEIKDTKTVSYTKQLRAQQQVANASGQKPILITGTNTKVTKNVSNNFEIIRDPSIGPQQ